MSALATLAAPAAALPDLRVDRPSIWSSPIVLRRTSGAVPGPLSDDPSIFGDALMYWNAQYSNIGNAAATPTISRFTLDGEVGFESASSSVAPGAVVDLLNNSQFVRGGLHTCKFAVNPSGLFLEDSTSNNALARQARIDGAELAMGAIVSRSAPPDPLGGTDAVQGTVYPNQDGLHITGGNKWEVVALRPAAAQDYDLNLFAQGFGIGSGFRTPLKTSALGAGATDFIITNPTRSITSNHDVGIQYYSGGTQAYSIEHREAALSLASGSTYTGLTLAQNQMVAIHQYTHDIANTAPRMAFELTTAPGVIVRIAIFSGSNAEASRSEAMATSVVDANGRAVLDLPLAAPVSAAPFAIVVYRDQIDGGTAPVSYTLRVRATPADLANAAHAGNTTPVNASNGASNWTTDPNTLDGNTNNTNMSFYFNNAGAVAATGYRVDTRLDGQSILPFSPGSLAPGATSFQAIAPFTVRGGRHTLSYALDIDGSIDETFETNNTYARQFVWSPKLLTDGATLLRALPPDPVAGLDAIPLNVQGYSNCDGLRTDPNALSDANPLANVVALMPATGSDVDIDAFPLSTGPLNGFDTPLSTSQRGSALTDLLVYLDPTGPSPMDVGVRRFAGTNQVYTIQNAFSAWLSTPDPPTIGPGVIGSSSIVKAFTFARSSHPTMTVILDNLSGDADLGMSIYSYTAAGAHSITETLPGGFVDAVGPGISEGTVVTTPAGRQFIAVVVWKTGWTELTKTASFRLRIDPVTADVTPALPHEVAFAIAGDNPMSAGTKLRFDLPAAAPVSIDLLDLQGRRMRSIASGIQSAGSHTLAFDGIDDAGQRLRNGAYFVRFSSGGMTRVHKLVVLH